MYSQNNEEQVLLSYFAGHKDETILSIGENNGKDLSNTLALIEQYGFGGVLVEPSPKVFDKLTELHLHRENVYCFKLAVSDYIGMATFYESGEHLGHGDSSLLSTLHEAEVRRWSGTKNTFRMIPVNVVNFKGLLNISPIKKFSFISIDAEGSDFTILKQIDLSEVECKCVCIEYNANEEILHEIKAYCEFFGLRRELLRNAENIIMAK